MDMKNLCAESAKLRGHLSAWDEVVSEIVLHDNEIADLWQRKSNLACYAGTWVHAMFERTMNGFHIVPGCMTKELGFVMSIHTS